MEIEQFFNERRYSPISDEFPCKIKYRKFYEAHKTEITIGPGEMIFIPAGWFHLVFSDTDHEGVNFAINQWYNAQDMQDGVSGDVKPFKSKHDLILDPNSFMDPDTEIRAMTSPNGKFGSTSVATSKFEEGLSFINLTWAEFWEQKRKDSYLVQWECPELDKYEKGREHFKGSTIWLNFAKVNSYLHYDRDDNFLMQVKGTKKILLFPPEDHPLLYTFNPYPLSTLEKLQKCWNNWCKVQTLDNSNIYKNIHKFIYFLGDEDSVRFTDPDLLEEYLNTIDIYTNILYDHCPRLDKPLEPEFVVTKSECITNFEYYHPNIHVIIFLTDSFLMIENSEYVIRKGQIVCFPNYWTYKWGVSSGSIVILAVARQSTAQEPASCPQ